MYFSTYQTNLLFDKWYTFIPVTALPSLSDYNAFISVCQYAAESGAHVLIAVVNCTANNYVTSVLEHLRIPTIIMQEDACDIKGGIRPSFTYKSSMVTQVSVGKSHVINIIKALIAEQNWERIVIFYDNVNGVYW
jgi:hypothetical protein